MRHWLVVTSLENFQHDRDVLGFKTQGLSYRFRNQVMKMSPEDRVLYYIMKKQKFGATATITGDYYEEHTKIWTDDDEMWPARRPSKPDYVLNDDELIDVKKYVDDLSFIRNKSFWGTAFQGSIKEIPEEDFRLIESEIKNIVLKRSESIPATNEQIEINEPRGEAEFEQAIMQLPLQSNSLHDRLSEMLEQIGSWMGYNAQTRHKIVPDHAYELDVAWLSGRNPEIAIEVQISGNLTEAKDRLAQARKFNYRKVIIVLRSSDLDRLNKIMGYEPDLKSWMEAWSINSVYKMFRAGEEFFSYFKKLREAVYKEKTLLELVM